MTHEKLTTTTTKTYVMFIFLSIFNKQKNNKLHILTQKRTKIIIYINNNKKLKKIISFIKALHIKENLKR